MDSTSIYLHTRFTIFDGGSKITFSKLLYYFIIVADLCQTRNLFSYTNMHKSFIFALMKDHVVPRRKEIVLCTEIASIKHVN